MIEHAAQQPTIRPAPGGVVGAIVTDVAPRCWKCGHQMAYKLTQPWHLRCPRCRSVNRRPQE